MCMTTQEKMLIGGRWVDAASGETQAIINPFDASVIAQVGKAGAEDANQAIAAAKRAFYENGWGETAAPERSRLLNAFAGLMEKGAEELARLETLNTGKAIVESQCDVADSIACLHYYAGLVNKPLGYTYSVSDPAVCGFSVREPVGVCGMISAWNFPISLAVWKIAPALAAGNSIVFKPAELTPLSAIRMFEMLEKAGYPDGVVNLVTGPGRVVGQTIAESDDVDKVAFTGGIDAGRHVMRAAAGNMKNISMELGGKSPNIIFADANFDAAVDYGLFGIFYNQGEVCSAASRLIVENSIYDRYLEALVAKTKKIKIGNGLDLDVRMGPLISEEHMNNVLTYIELGVREGATLACGGKRIVKPGYEKGFFVEPTVFTDTRPDMRIVREEIFGPVVILQRFDGEEEAVRLANDTSYGLAAGVFSSDISKAIRVIRKVRAGITWINSYGPVYNEAPWGGYRQSGIGRELGISGIEDYTEVKQININTNVTPTGWFD